MGNQPTKHSGRPKKAVHWKSAEPPSPPGKPTLVPGTPNSSEPDVVTLRWKRPTSDGGSPILGYIIEHRRTGSPHWVRASAQLIHTTELSLSGLEPGWRYQFRVIAQNIVGQSDSSELSDPLTVTLQRAAVAPPRFTSELFDVTAVEDEKIELRVSFTGTPMPQISWYKDGFEMFSSRRTKIFTEGDISVLVIHQAALTDEGEIKCTATNRAGHTVTRCNIMIDAYPKIRLPRQYEDGLIIEADEVIRLKVGIAGQPAPIVEWSHNGELLSNDDRHEIETSDKSSTLKISNAQRYDRGEYNLRAYNKLGDDFASFLVTVTARPEAPGKVNISLNPGKAVTLSWSAPEDDGGCKIGNYIVEYYRIGWDVWLKATTCRQLSTTLGGLFEGSQYRFRVKAENPYGVSDPSPESDTLFIPDLKRGISSATQTNDLEEKENIPQQLSLPRKRRDESRSPAREVEQVKKVKAFTPETYSRTEIVREMSYGARDEDFFKPIAQQEPPKKLTPEPSPSPVARLSPARRLSPAPSSSVRSSPQPTPKLPQPAPPPTPPAVIITEPVPMEVVPQPEPVPLTVQRPAQSPLTCPLKAMEKFSKEPSPLLASLRASSDNQLTPVSAGSHSSPTSPAVPADKPAIHNSSEFMLVLYNGREAKNNTRNSTFDFELDEMVAPPPPLSLSSPELNVEPPPVPAMRPAVSSTELLYERAMARFYQAVAMEESENQRREAERRRSFGATEHLPLLQLEQQQQQPQQPQQVPPPALSLLQSQPQPQLNGTDAAANRLTDRRSSLRRRLSGDKEAIVKQSSFESDSSRQHSSAMEEVIREEKEEIVDKNHVDVVDDAVNGEEQEMVEEVVEDAVANNIDISSAPALEEIAAVEKEKLPEPVQEDDDKSSISSSMDSMIEELRRRELSARSSRSRILSEEDEEMETYHPGERVRSPYRNPDPSQAIQVLSKPLPMPDPNFVPKPILKRPSTEILTKDEKEKRVAPSKPERKDMIAANEVNSPVPEVPSPTPPVQREKTPEPAPVSPQPELPMSEKQGPSELEIKTAIVSEAARQRRLESRQSSIEESRAVADFYGEILDRVENSKKPRKLPNYVSPDEIRKMQGRECSRETSFDRFVRSRSGSQSPLPPDEIYRLTKSRSPSLTSEQIVIKGKPARESKILRQRSASTETEPSRPPSNAKDHPPIMGTTARPDSAFSSAATGPAELSRISRPLRESGPIIKRRNVSQTRSRSSSGTRDAESIPDGRPLELARRAKRDAESVPDGKPIDVARRVRLRADSKSPSAIQRGPANNLNHSAPEPPKAPQALPTPSTASATPQGQLTPEVRSRSESRTREPTPQEASLKSTLSYLTDVALFTIACWLYLFKNPKWAIPVIILIMYRHISDALRDRIPPWMKRTIS